MESEKLLTYQELADRWKIKLNTLRNWVMCKKLKPIKLGASVRFSESYIRDLESKGGV